MEMKRRKKNQVNSRRMKKMTLNILLTFGNWGFHLPFPSPYKWKLKLASTIRNSVLAKLQGGENPMEKKNHDVIVKWLFV